MLTERYRIYVGNIEATYNLFGVKDYSTGAIVEAEFTAKTTAALENRLMQRLHTLNGIYKYTEVIDSYIVIDSNDDPYEPTYDDMQADWEYMYGSEKAIAEYLNK